MNASSVNWRNKIHDNMTLKNILQFFFSKYWIGKFFMQFWENLEEIRIGIRPQIGSKKTTERGKFLILLKIGITNQRVNIHVSRTFFD